MKPSKDGGEKLGFHRRRRARQASPVVNYRLKSILQDYSGKKFAMGEYRRMVTLECIQQAFTTLGMGFVLACIACLREEWPPIPRRVIIPWEVPR